ncbi:NB-ARC domain disease resistance protein [Medicago truncatula]|uniref:NB-ARC domain disease resistance protein n=1 Tax=Medicago truncatula TaxID=3880 RepID=A0A072UBD8_MEDTR|nr:NB-ARC domain disease resistance protein [Medicago truncatula]
MWKAFKNSIVDSSYDDILDRAIAYASGLPLVLELVGPALFGKNIEEWKSTLDRYERIPNKEIHNILKISFDALEEDEQGVFLDIACCFKGYDLGEVEDILCAYHGQCIEYHIGVLVEKTLIKIIQLSSHAIVTLHDLIEDMGKEIELHEYGGAEFIFTRSTRFPEWFEHQNRGPSISFWFRSKLPTITLFVVCKLMWGKYDSDSTHNEGHNNELIPLNVQLFINGYEYGFCNLEVKQYHRHVFDLQLHDKSLKSILDKDGNVLKK